MLKEKSPDQGRGMRGSEGGVCAMDHNGMGCGFEGGGIRSARGPGELWGGGVMQMKVAEYNAKAGGKVSKEEVKAARKVAEKIDSKVDEAREQALNWPAFKDDKGYLGQWYKAASKYIDAHDNMDEEKTKLLHARFGYAVEVLACRELGAVEEGLDVYLQVAKEGTRPDVVLSQNKKKGAEVGWLDITASKSAKHIYGKNGRGWVDKPYVAEILYKSLNPLEVLTGEKNAVTREIGHIKRKQQEIREDERSKCSDALGDKIEKFYGKHEFQKNCTSQSTRLKTTKNFFKNDLKMGLGRECNKNLMGGLELLGFKSGWFGLKNQKRSSKLHFVNHIRVQSDVPIKKRMGRYVGRKIRKKETLLGAYRHFKAVENFLKRPGKEDEQRLWKSTALLVSIEIQNQLEDLYCGLERYQDTNGVCGRIVQHVDQRPKGVDIQELKEWCGKTEELLEEGNEMLDEREELEEEEDSDD